MMGYDDETILRRAVGVLCHGMDIEKSPSILNVGFRVMGNAAAKGDYQEWANAARLIAIFMNQAAAAADEKAAAIYQGEGI